MYQCNGEVVDHLLICCDFAYVLLSLVFIACGIQWVFITMVDDLLLWRSWNLVLGSIHQTFGTCPIMFDGAIVKGVNSRTIEDIEISKTQLESLPI